MEKEKLTNRCGLRRMAKALALSLILAIPIIGMLVTSSRVLAEVELGDPVELYKTHPWSMQFFRWCLILALCFAMTPFKNLSALAAGLAVGGLAFYGLDLYHQLKELSEMGLSAKPLTEMVVLSPDGKWLVAWSGLTLCTQILVGLVPPISGMVQSCKGCRGSGCRKQSS